MLKGKLFKIVNDCCKFKFLVISLIKEKLFSEWFMLWIFLVYDSGMVCKIKRIIKLKLKKILLLILLYL